MLYFADKKWWDWHRERPEFQSFAGEKCTVFTTGHEVDDPEIAMLRNAGVEGVSADPYAIRTGSNSGHQALNIAILAGGNPIILVGYDAKDSAKGRKHFFGDHPDKTQPPYQNMIRELRHAKAAIDALGVRVINVTPDSALDMFERMTLAEALA